MIMGVAPAAGAQSFVDFPIGQKVPEDITGGPDGNVWFANYTGSSIGRITPEGAITEFPTPTFNSTDIGIALGPDGNLWFTEATQSKIGRITPQGVITEFPTPGSADPFQHHAPAKITSGPGGNLWFTERVGNIGRITTAGVITEFPVTDTNAGMNGIAPGPDGNLWFCEDAANKVGRMTPTGVVTEFPVTTPFALPQSITAGPDGNLWFTEGAGNRIGRITPAGVITEYSIPTAAAFPSAITVGPDGNLWFSEYAHSIGRITTGGIITEFSITLPALTLCVGIATGPDGNLWISEDNGSGDRIGRFTLPAVTPLSFYTVPPCRIVDTRGPAGAYGAPALITSADRTFLLGGHCGIPATAKAVSMNVTVTGATSGPGFLTLFPGGTSRPLSSTINYGAGATRANNAVAPLGVSGDLVVHCAQGSGTVQLIIDVDGYFQ